MERLLGTSVTFLTLLAELVVLFLGVSFVVKLLTRRVGLDRLGQWMGGGRFVGALKGIALGFVTPFCTYSAIPMLVGLLQAGVGVSTAAGFLLAAPVLDPILFAAIAVLFSPTLAVGYTAVTFAGVLTAALAADLLGLENDLHVPATPVAGGAAGEEGDAACQNPGSAADGPWRGWRPEVKRSARSAADLTRSMAVPLVVAVAVAAAIVGYLPSEFLLSVAGAGQWWAVPSAAAVGVPFYVSVEALAPIGAALAEKGMGLGAVFALTIAAAGVNVPEFALLTKMLTRRAIAGLVAAVFVVAVGGGWLVELV